MTDDSEIRRRALLRAQAAFDGELDAVNALSFETDLESDPSLQRAWRRWRGLTMAFKRHAPKDRATSELRARVLALANPGSPAHQTFLRQTRLGGLAASLVAVGFVLGFFVAGQRASHLHADVPDTLVAAYARAQLSGQAFDIASSDRHTVKPWLASRAPLGTEVVDLADAGFPLAGGRLDMLDRAPAATLVYRRREHWIDVTELPIRGTKFDEGSGAKVVDGYLVRQWNDNARDYVVISDIDDAELETFIDAFRRKVRANAAGSTISPAVTEGK